MKVALAVNELLAVKDSLAVNSTVDGDSQFSHSKMRKCDVIFSNGADCPKLADARSLRSKQSGS